MEDLKENNYYLARKLSQRENQLKSYQKMELGFGMTKNKLKYKIQHCENSLDELENTISCLKSFAVQFLDDCSAVVQKLRNEMGEISQMYDHLRCNNTLKTQTVRPMVAGLPLKRAMITLKRLNPHHLQLRDTNIESTGHYGRPKFQLERVLEESNHRRRSFSQQRRHRTKQINSAQRRRSSSHSASMHSERFGVPHQVPVGRQRTYSGVPLKKASIHLKRLDSRLVPSEHDEAGVEASVEAPAATVSNGAGEDLRAPVGDRRPMVVLERMERYEYFAGTCNSEDSTPLVESTHGLCANYQVSDEHCPNSVDKNVSFPINVQQEVQSDENSQTSATNIAVCFEANKKPLVSLIDIGRSFKSFTVCVKKNKKSKVKQKEKLQKKEEKGNKQIEKVPESQELERKDSLSTVEFDEVVSVADPASVASLPLVHPEDPLEGPSWLYNEATPLSTIKAFKRKKSSCVVTYIESSDESIYNEPPRKRRVERKRKRSRFHKKSSGSNVQGRKKLVSPGVPTPATTRSTAGAPTRETGEPDEQEMEDITANVITGDCDDNYDKESDKYDQNGENENSRFFSTCIGRTPHFRPQFFGEKVRPIQEQKRYIISSNFEKLEITKWETSAKE